MPDYIDISDAEIVPGQPVTAALMTRMRDNPIAIAQNDEAVPSALLGNFVPRALYFGVPGSYSITVPDGVHRLKLTLVGGGGGGSASINAGSAGGASTVTVNGVTYTANGGPGGGTGGAAATTVNIPFGVGLSISGHLGAHGGGGSTAWGIGGAPAQARDNAYTPGAVAGGFGGGGGGVTSDADGVDGVISAFPHQGGGGGALGIVSGVVVLPGQTINITIGSAGLGGINASIGDHGGDGTNGLVIIEF